MEYTINNEMHRSIGDTLKLVGRTLTQNNVPDDNNINTATAVIENVFKFQIGATEITEFVLNRGSINGTFVVGQSVIAAENDDDTLVIKATISGIPDVFTFTNDGALYSRDTVTLLFLIQEVTVLLFKLMKWVTVVLIIL